MAEAASEEELPVREKHDFRTFFNSCVWGFGFIRAWVYLMFLGMGVGVLSGASSSDCVVVYLCSSTMLTITLFAGGIAPQGIDALGWPDRLYCDHGFRDGVRSWRVHLARPSACPANDWRSCNRDWIGVYPFGLW